MPTQPGYICFFRDDSGNYESTYFKYYKARRVASFAMAEKVIAFSNSGDFSNTLSSELRSAFNRRVNVQLLTDSENLFDVISKSARIFKKMQCQDLRSCASPRQIS